MRFEKVQEEPVIFVTCKRCKRAVRSKPYEPTSGQTGALYKPLWADLDGEPFRAYYCDPCRVALEAVKV